jgi:hypothetical protein
MKKARNKVRALNTVNLESNYLLLQEPDVSLLQLHPGREPVAGSTLPQDFRNSDPLIKNIFIAIPAKAIPNKMIDKKMSLSVITRLI